jgi:hypothetical protein
MNTTYNNIPSEYLDSQVYLKAVHTGHYLHDDGSCSSNSKSLMILSRSSGWSNVISIQSVSQQGCFLRVQDCETGQCSFLDNGFELSTQFRVETAADATKGIALYVISCATGNLLQCVVRGQSTFAYCCDLNRDPRKAWTIVLPEDDSKPSVKETTNIIADDETKEEKYLNSGEDTVTHEYIESKTKEDEDTKLQAVEETKATTEVNNTKATPLPPGPETTPTSQGVTETPADGSWSLPEGPWRIAAGFALGVAAMPVLTMAANAAAVMGAMGSTMAPVGVVAAGAMALVAGTKKGDESEKEGKEKDSNETNNSANTSLLPLAGSTFSSVVGRVGTIAGSFSLVPGSEKQEPEATSDGSETDSPANTGPVPWTMPTFGSVITRVGTIAEVFSLVEEGDAAAAPEIHSSTETGDGASCTNALDETIEFY